MATRPRCWLALPLLIALAATARAEPGLDFFEKRIRPVLAEHCYPCHSQQAAKRCTCWVSITHN
jgi:hypothetical protein